MWYLICLFLQLRFFPPRTPACRSSAPCTEGSFTVAGRQLRPELCLVMLWWMTSVGDLKSELTALVKTRCLSSHWLSTLRYLAVLPPLGRRSCLSCSLLVSPVFQDCVPALFCCWISFFKFFPPSQFTGEIRNHCFCCLWSGWRPAFRPGHCSECEDLKIPVMPLLVNNLYLEGKMPSDTFSSCVCPKRWLKEIASTFPLLPSGNWFSSPLTKMV